MTMSEMPGNDEKRRLFVDADGFPHLESTIDIALKLGINIVVAGNMTQNLGRLEGIDGLQIIEVSDGMDAADFAILNHMETGDIVLTIDTGLAALVLGKGGVAIDPGGHLYGEEGINGRLLARHVGRKVRRSGGRTKGKKKISQLDREKYAHKIEAMLKRILG